MGEASAAESNLGVFCASGWHTGSLTMRADRRDDADQGRRHGRGDSRFSWPRPVVPGDVLRVEIEVMEARVSKSRPDKGVVPSLNHHVQPARRAGAALHPYGAVPSAGLARRGRCVRRAARPIVPRGVERPTRDMSAPSNGNAVDWFVDRHVREGDASGVAFEDPWRR